MNIYQVWCIYWKIEKKNLNINLYLSDTRGVNLYDDQEFKYWPVPEWY